MKILNNDKGMSLIEIMIAAAVSIAVVMGVMKINESSQRGFKSIELKSELKNFQNRVQVSLMSQDKCSAGVSGQFTISTALANANYNPAGLTNANAAQTPPGVPNFNAYASTDSFSVVTGPGPDGCFNDVPPGCPANAADDNTSIDLTNGQPIPGASNWEVSSDIRLFPYTVPNDGSEQCYLFIQATKTGGARRGSVGGETKNLWFPISCVIDGSFNLVSCNGQDLVAQGLFQDNGNGSWGTAEDLHMLGNIFIGGNYNLAETAQLRVEGVSAWNAIPADPNIVGISQAIELPTNQAITFGDDNRAGLWSIGDNRIRTNGNFDAMGAISSALAIRAEFNVSSSQGNVTALNGALMGQDLTISNNANIANNLQSATLVTTSDATIGANVVVTGNVGSATSSTTGNATIGGDLAVTGNINGLGAEIQSSHQFYSNYMRAVTMEAANFTYTPSDERFKKEVQTIENASEKLDQLNPVTYVMRRDEFPEKGFDDKLHCGLIAQELEKIFPEFVGENREG